MSHIDRQLDCERWLFALAVMVACVTVGLYVYSLVC